MRLTDAFVAYAFFSLCLHLGSQAIVLWRLHRRLPPRPPVHEPITLVRPVSRLDPCLDETLESTFRLHHPDVRIIFCAARDDDPAVPVVRALMAAHPMSRARLLIGDTSVPTRN